MTRSWVARILMCCLASGAVSGCSLLRPQKDPTQFFVLSPAATSDASLRQGDQLVVGVGPISLPEYLDRSNIVRRFAPNRIAISEYEWWAEPLGTALPRVTGDNLATHLGSATVLLYPWPLLLKPTYAVAISFSRFDIVGPERVQLAAHWALRSSAHDTVLTHDSIIEKPTAGATTADAVAALSQALDELSAEIATAIGTQRATAPAPNKSAAQRRGSARR